MREDKFHIELALVREDGEEGTTTDLAITVATVFNEQSAGEMFKLFAGKLGMEEYVLPNGHRRSDQ